MISSKRLIKEKYLVSVYHKILKNRKNPNATTGMTGDFWP